MRGSGPHHLNMLEALHMSLVLPTQPHRRCAIPIRRHPHVCRRLGPGPAYAVTAGAQYTQPLVSSAQAMRAFLLATTTITSIGGLCPNIRLSHEPAGTPLRFAQRTTALEAK